ncbi:MAG TPA: thiamine-phosphate kinase [Rhodopila sp.]|uniref:thiamine-phosphate kinase n=1 Tax=Rhodopila sp. TaxID=2480087 RepID=UPI002C5CDDBF|nr:thiamine-phosphate kinase [Rhodopila sp.]HVY16850.1 thiamine-phosphate kinase [Rhodopila sp.]
MTSPSPLPAEFDLIARHFRPLAGPGALGLRDDAALLMPPPGRELVLTVDAMVAGVHFLPDDPPDLVGRKLLRVNLSDLAAKGAAPLAYLMTVSAPRGTPDAWFAGFAAGLAQDQATFGVSLLGGDTTSTPGPLSLSLTIIGHVAPGTAVHRTGAQPGNSIWVTGTIGDGALGLQAARGRVADPTGHLLGRYRLPRPRIGLPIAGIASASMDVSDGLVQDLGHICRASDVGAVLLADSVPLSEPARAAGPDWFITCLTGGDDYEVLMAVPPDREPALRSAAEAADIPVTRVGHFTSGPAEVMVRRTSGESLALDKGGWSHF